MSVQAFLAGLRALGILLGVWLVLGAVGAIAGVLPPVTGAFAGSGASPEAEASEGEASETESSPEDPEDAEPTRESEAEAETETETAAVADSTTAEAEPGESPEPEGGATSPSDATSATADEGGEPAPSSAPPAAVATGVGVALSPQTVCAGTDRTPPLVALNAGTLLVGCGDHADLLQRWPRDGEKLVRTLRVSRAAARPNASVEASAVGHADINGDGAEDLIVGFVERDPEGATVGGGLYLVPSVAGGAFGEPLELAPIPVTALAFAALDQRDGVDLVALHRPDAFGRRPAEAWVFSGGPAPTRIARVNAGAATSIALVDLNRDDHPDLLLGKPAGSLRVYLGDAEGRFEREVEVMQTSAEELALADVDGDGAIDAIARSAKRRAPSAPPARTRWSQRRSASRRISGRRARWMSTVMVATTSWASSETASGTFAKRARSPTKPPRWHDLPLDAGTPRWAMGGSRAGVDCARGCSRGFPGSADSPFALIGPARLDL